MSFNIGGFYAGVFYPTISPLYQPPGGEDLIYGACFALEGQGSLYRGFLYETAELREDYYLYS